MNPIDAAGARPREREVRLHDVWTLVVRNRWTILGVFVASLALAGLVTWMQRPVYESGTTLRLDDENSKRNLLGDLGSLPGAGKGDAINTEMEVLRSRRVADQVVDRLALNVRLERPALPRARVFSAIYAPRSTPSGQFALTRQSDGTYAAAVRRGPVVAGLPTHVALGAPFHVGELVLSLNPALRADPPAEIVFSALPARDAAEELRRGLRVGRPNPEAEIISVQYRSPDPVLVAQVPNAVAESFVQYKTVTTRTESQSTVDFLREQVGTYERQLRDAEAGMRRYREQAQVVSLSAEATEQVKRLAEMQAQRDALVTEREGLQQFLTRVQHEPASPDGPSPYRRLASFPTFFSNRAVQDVLQSLTQLENERSKLLVRRTDENVDVQGINTRIRELEGQLNQTAGSYLAGLNAQIASADASLGRFSGQLAGIPDREIHFASLMRQQKLLEDIYSLLQTRLKEAEIQNAVKPGDVRVVDDALVQERPVSPKPLLNFGIAAVLGLVLGLAAGMAREALDTRVRTSEDVHQVTGGLAVLGVIPRIRSTPQLSNGRTPARLGAGLDAASPEAVMGERLITNRDPRSPASEAYRALRTNLIFSGTDRSPQLVVVTSAMPGEGKSTSSSNLAITLAQQGTRILLVDVDLRRGLLHHLFGLPQDPGLTHVLLGKATLDDAIHEVDTGSDGLPLHFLSAGVFPPNPSEVLGSRRMKELLEEMRQKFEVVIFDAPPLNLVTDAAVLGSMADATLLVARSGTTQKGALHQAAAQLQHVRAVVTGVVLNDFNRPGAAYGYYGSGYGGSDNGNGKHG